ncbi:EAL domain-containing protein [Kitasatospora sp. NPDC001539]|uniref:putative bifunctional diguanylate cyclase/phosphodiesterase n=1 Tax=Kitasatospora sp. NPDC001539 TaxID=3154384 RepID=UPI00331C5EF2
MTHRRRRLMVCYLIWMVLFTGIYFADPGLRIIWWTGMGLGGVAAIVVGVRLNRPRHPLFWYLLALANLCFTTGEAVQALQLDILHLNNPFPSVGDGFYLAEFVLYAVGLLGFIRWRTARQDRAGMLDALIITLGLALLVWIYLILPYARNPDLTWLQKAVSIAYPLGDVVVLALLLRLLTPRGGKSRSLQLLTVGALGLLTSDILYGLIQLHGTWRIGTGVELGWAAFYAAWGAAALHPSMVELTRPVPTQHPDLSAGRLVLLTLASLIAPVILIIESLAGNTDNAGVIGAFSGLLYLLVLARLAVVVVARRQAVARERTLREAGARLTAAVTVSEVADAVQAAASLLMPAERGHVALLAVAESGGEQSGAGAAGAAGGGAGAGGVAAGGATAEGAAPGSPSAGRPSADGAAADGAAPGSAAPGSAAASGSGVLHVRRAGQGAAHPHPAPTGADDEVLALAADRETRLLPVGSISLPDHLGRMPCALVCPLTLSERPSGDPAIGVLVVTGTEQELTSLWGSLEILAAQAALAVERVVLSQEVTRRNSELYFRTLVQNASDVILIIDADDCVRYASSSAERVLGYPELNGTLLTDLVPTEDSRAVGKALARMRGPADPPRGDQPREHWRLLRQDRTPIEVEVRSTDLRDDPTVGGLVLTLRDVTEQRQMERELTHRAFHDSLTGLANRVLFQDRVGHALSRSERSGAVTGVLFIDLDDFKMVNDTQGHAVGDELLVAVSLRISTALRSSDTAARLGGDEFAVLVEDALRPGDVDTIAGNVLAVFAEPFKLSAGAVRVSASIGVATTEDSVDAAELLTHADLALYSAKAAGRRQWCHYRPALQAGLVERHELNENLDLAIAESAFQLYYQPIVDLRTGDLVGFEALVRWPRDRRGMVLPDEFIALAEESGQIVPLGAWVLERAAQEAAVWHAASSAARAAAGRPPLRVNVNVSARQFRDAGFMEVVHHALDTSGIDPRTLVLELTESVLMRHDDRLRADMATLGNLGVGLAIDDFGTGYSSLSYLREFPISILKIDKSFIDGLGHSAQQYALVEGITRIADTLDVQVIAEGIEHPDQRDLLAAMGCPLGQGYLFAHPMDGTQARALVRSTTFEAA